MAVGDVQPHATKPATGGEVDAQTLDAAPRRAEYTASDAGVNVWYRISYCADAPPYIHAN
jgi:hypothetical protein